MSTVKKTIEPLAPDDPSWKVTFSLFSWWQTLDGRLFVINQRWSDNEGNLKYLELLEREIEEVKILPYLQFFEQFRAGRLQKISKSGVPIAKEMLPAISRRDLRPDYNS